MLQYPPWAADGSSSPLWTVVALSLVLKPPLALNSEGLLPRSRSWLETHDFSLNSFKKKKRIIIILALNNKEAHVSGEI